MIFVSPRPIFKHVSLFERSSIFINPTWADVNHLNLIIINITKFFNNIMLINEYILQYSFIDAYILLTGFPCSD